MPSRVYVASTEIEDLEKLGILESIASQEEKKDLERIEVLESIASLGEIEN